MTVYIHYKPKASPGYTPHPTLRLFNVEAVIDAGVGMVKIKMQFSDAIVTHDHVSHVAIQPETA